MTSVTNYLEMYGSDKTAALLTNTQRGYLAGDSVSKSYERNLRNSIQDRIEATMRDFVRLFTELNQDDVREAFGTSTADKIQRDNEEFRQAVENATDPTAIEEENVEESTPTPRSTVANAPALIAFLLRGLNYQEKPIHEYFEETNQEQPAFEEFIEVVEQGISLYINQETAYTARVSVEINLEGLTPVDELVEQTNSE